MFCLKMQVWKKNSFIFLFPHLPTTHKPKIVMIHEEVHPVLWKNDFAKNTQIRLPILPFVYPKNTNFKKIVLSSSFPTSWSWAKSWWSMKKCTLYCEKNWKVNGQRDGTAHNNSHSAFLPRGKSHLGNKKAKKSSSNYVWSIPYTFWTILTKKL